VSQQDLLRHAEASSRSINVILATVAPLFLAAHNPYTESVLTTSSGSRSRGFRARVVRYYMGDLGAVCMLTELTADVIAAHILPHAASQPIVLAAGLTRIDVGTPRNGLLLHSAVEKAFDRLDISFVPGSILEPNSLFLKIWTAPGLRPKSDHPGDARFIAVGSGTLSDYEGRRLTWPVRVAHPLKRALSFQARLACERARKNDWTDGSTDTLDFGSPNDGVFSQISAQIRGRLPSTAIIPFSSDDEASGSDQEDVCEDEHD
jgi:hypothetical protein